MEAADDFDAAVMTNFEKKFENNLNFGISKIEKAYDTLELQAACNNFDVALGQDPEILGSGEESPDARQPGPDPAWPSLIF